MTSTTATIAMDLLPRPDEAEEEPHIQMDGVAPVVVLGVVEEVVDEGEEEQVVAEEEGEEQEAEAEKEAVDADTTTTMILNLVEANRNNPDRPSTAMTSMTTTMISFSRTIGMFKSIRNHHRNPRHPTRLIVRILVPVRDASSTPTSIK